MNTKHSSYFNRVIKKAEHDMESQYSNFYGGKPFYGSDFHGNRNENGPMPARPQQIDPLDRTIVIISTNATDSSATAIIFGLDAQGDAQSAGSGTGITITTGGTAGHAEIKRQMGTKPFTVMSLKLRTTAAAQFDNTITYRARSMSGRNLQLEITPTDYSTQLDNTPTVVTIPTIAGTLFDGATQLSVSVNTGVTLTWIFTVRERAYLGDALKGESIVQQNTMPAPTGAIMQIQEQIGGWGR